MKTITATEPARNLRKVLDCMVHDGEEIAIERKHQQIARLVPGPRLQTALEAMADLYRTLLPGAAGGWIKDSREYPGRGWTDEGVHDPWDSYRSPLLNLNSGPKLSEIQVYGRNGWQPSVGCNVSRF